MQALVVLVTCPDAETAAAIAKTIVSERLAACGNILPGLRSLYTWEGAVQDEAEALLLIKTTAAAYPALETRLAALHPYDVPEIIALPVEHGLAAYLRWVADSVA